MKERSWMAVQLEQDAKDAKIAALKEQVAQLRADNENLLAEGKFTSCQADKYLNQLTTEQAKVKVLTDALITCKSSTRFNLQEEPITTYYFDHKKVIDALATVNGE